MTGMVLDLAGTPLRGATVSAGDVTATTGADGRFVLRAPAPGLLQVSAPAHLPRTEVAAPGRPVLSRLTPQDGHTVSLLFGGDVMAGRRFYDADEDGRPQDALLRPGDTAQVHADLLGDVLPYLRQPDLTVVNLESPLGEDPAFDPTKARPERFHATKDYAFSSAKQLAAGLSRAGVDIVDVGNNHLFDRLDVGLAETLRTLDESGLRHYGAGRNADEAWQPVRVTVRGERLSFLGCTTITGEDDPTPYIATDSRAGAASCEERRLVDAVRRERATGATVFASVHGGYEYRRDQSPRVLRLSVAARRAGAHVVNHHPHVIGGVEHDGRTAYADSLGNLLFDQEVQPTFASYLLSADVRRGRLVRLRTEPLLVEGYLPTPVLGRMADVTSRFAAGVRAGGGTYGPDGAEALPGGAVVAQDAVATLAPGRTRLLAPGWSATGTSRPDLQLGQELLWTGSFEDETTSASGGGHLWDLRGSATTLSPDAAHAGAQGVEMRAPASGAQSALLTTEHRLVLPQRLLPVTTVGWLRADRSVEVELELHWYPDTKGPSTAITRHRVAVGAAWRPASVDATPPGDAVAVQLFVRLPVTAAGATAFVDDLALVQWSRPGTPATPLHGAVRARGSVQRVAFTARVPAGSSRLEGYLPRSALLASP